MSFFGPKSESYIGIDVGSSAIKMVEFKKENGRAKLVTYGYAEQNSNIFKAERPENKQAIAETIKTIHQQARMTTKKIIAALPSYTVFSSVLTLPEKSKKELEAIVEQEARKFVPMPLEEMVLDWKIVEGLAGYGHLAGGAAIASDQLLIQKKEAEQIKVLITAAPKDVVNRYTEVIKLSGLELVSLETESFALERALVGHDKSAIGLIDLGAFATNIVIVMESVPLFSRSIDMGGQTITKEIAKRLQVDPETAEQFQRDFGLNTAPGENSLVAQISKEVVEAIINEVHYLIDIYQKESTIPLEKIILAGGAAWLPQLADFLSQSLGLKTFIGDPWGRIIYPPELKPVLKEIGPSFAVAIGLAMREIV